MEVTSRGPSKQTCICTKDPSTYFPIIQHHLREWSVSLHVCVPSKCKGVMLRKQTIANDSHTPFVSLRDYLSSSVWLQQLSSSGTRELTILPTIHTGIWGPEFSVEGFFTTALLTIVFLHPCFLILPISVFPSTKQCHRFECNLCYATDAY